MKRKSRSVAAEAPPSRVFEIPDRLRFQLEADWRMEPQAEGEFLLRRERLGGEFITLRILDLKTDQDNTVEGMREEFAYVARDLVNPKYVGEIPLRIHPTGRLFIQYRVEVADRGTRMIALSDLACCATGPRSLRIAWFRHVYLAKLEREFRIRSGTLGVQAAAEEAEFFGAWVPPDAASLQPPAAEAPPPAP